MAAQKETLHSVTTVTVEDPAEGAGARGPAGARPPLAVAGGKLCAA